MPRRSKAATIDLKLRIKEPLRARIEKAAKANGRSMNAEMVSRLERSMSRDDGVGGPRVASLVDTILTVMKAAGEFAGFAATGKVVKDGGWVEIPYAFDQAVKAANAVLESLRPPGEIIVPTPNVTEVVGGDEDLAKANEQVIWIYEHYGELLAKKSLEDQEGES